MDRLIDATSVRPGLGLGELLFGTSINDAIAYLGEPTRHEQLDPLLDGIGLYWDETLSCTYYTDDDLRLGTISIERYDAVLADRCLMGMGRDDVLAHLTPLFGEPTWKDMSSVEFPDHWQAWFDSRYLSLWFDCGLLETIQWGYFFDESNKPIWPDLNQSRP